MLHNFLTPNCCSPKFSSRKYLQCRKNKLSVGIPSKSVQNAGTNANRYVISKNAAERGDAETAVVLEKPPPRLRRFEVFSGHPMPFGATPRDGGVNFSILSSNATCATLCLISLSDLQEVNEYSHTAGCLHVCCFEFTSSFSLLCVVYYEYGFWF